MALEHALLVSLAERAGAGIELTRRFDASIGFFWQASHQQIYKVLARMQEQGWLASEVVAQPDRPDTKVYVVTPAGHAELQRWLAEPTTPLAARSDLAVRLRGASYATDRAVILDDVRRLIAEHLARRDLFQQLCTRDYPEPAALDGQDLDHYLVLRGGLRLEQFWVDWLTEYLTAHTAKE